MRMKKADGWTQEMQNPDPKDRKFVCLSRNWELRGVKGSFFNNETLNQGLKNESWQGNVEKGWTFGRSNIKEINPTNKTLPL